MSLTNLNEIQKHIQDIVVELSNAYREAEILLSDSTAAEDRRIAKNTEMQEREKKISQDSDRLSEERAYLIQIRDSQKAKELRLQELAIQETKMEEILKEIEIKKNEVALAMEKLNEKKKQVEVVSIDIEKLKQERILIDKEKALDRNRKEMLDNREKQIDATEKRLQIMMSRV